MLVKTKGIIFRTMKYKESSLILDVYTEKYGLRSYIISGVRSKKSKTKSGLLQVMGLVELVSYHKNGSQLNRIKEVKAERFYSDIPFNVIKSSIGLFITEVCKKSIKEREQNQEMFDFLFENFCYLDQTKNSLALFPHIFMIKLTEILGCMPSNNRSEDAPIFNLQEGAFVKYDDQLTYNVNHENSAYFFDLLGATFENSSMIQIPKLNRSQLLDQLISFYKLHIEGFGDLQSLAIVREILE